MSMYTDIRHTFALFALAGATFASATGCGSEVNTASTGGSPGGTGGAGSTGSTGSTGGACGAFGGKLFSQLRGHCLGVGSVDPNYNGAWPNSASPPSPNTIDSMTMEPLDNDTYQVGGAMHIVGFGKDYFLSDSSTWESGAGSDQHGDMTLNSVVMNGSTISYHMSPDDLIVARTDYAGGDHSANYQIESLEDLTIVAEDGSTVGTVTSCAVITIDEPANYVDGRFNYLSAPLCSTVPITITYTLLDGRVFDEHLFDQGFNFSSHTLVTLASPGP